MSGLINKGTLKVNIRITDYKHIEFMSMEGMCLKTDPRKMYEASKRSVKLIGQHTPLGGQLRA
jgi:hypothetical protein